MVHKYFWLAYFIAPFATINNTNIITITTIANTITCDGDIPRLSGEVWGGLHLPWYISPPPMRNLAPPLKIHAATTRQRSQWLLPVRSKNDWSSTADHRCQVIPQETSSRWVHTSRGLILHRQKDNMIDTSSHGAMWFYTVKNAIQTRHPGEGELSCPPYLMKRSNSQQK